MFLQNRFRPGRNLIINIKGHKKLCYLCERAYKSSWTLGMIYRNLAWDFCNISLHYSALFLLEGAQFYGWKWVQNGVFAHHSRQQNQKVCSKTWISGGGLQISFDVQRSELGAMLPTFTLKYMPILWSLQQYQHI